MAISKNDWKVKYLPVSKQPAVYAGNELIAGGVTEANAHLIAAAPTHHELLKWIRDRVAEFGNLDSIRDEEIIEQLDTEIAKAEGR